MPGARQTAAEVESHGRRAEVRRLNLTDLAVVQPTIEYLCSPEGAYATGASFIVDGGLGLMRPVAKSRTGSG